MIIEIAKHAGFCYGVERALNLTTETGVEGDTVTLGPLIHNEQVVEKLEKQGIHVVERVEQAAGKTMIVRSHGAPKSVFEQAEEAGVKVVDATCPFVRKIQQTVAEQQAKGREIIIVGDPKHPEIVGINGWCNNKAHIVQDEIGAEGLTIKGPACIVVQTTFRKELFDKIKDILTPEGSDVLVFNTICAATSKRQDAAKELAERVDCMIVIGGKKSSNTKKLLEICQQHCENSHLIQTAEDLRVTLVDKCDKIGITAGASTPDWIIDDIVQNINDIIQK